MQNISYKDDLKEIENIEQSLELSFNDTVNLFKMGLCQNIEDILNIANFNNYEFDISLARNVYNILMNIDYDKKSILDRLFVSKLLKTISSKNNVIAYICNYLDDIGVSQQNRHIPNYMKNNIINTSILSYVFSYKSNKISKYNKEYMDSFKGNSFMVYNINLNDSTYVVKFNIDSNKNIGNNYYEYGLKSIKIADSNNTNIFLFTPEGWIIPPIGKARRELFNKIMKKAKNMLKEDQNIEI